MKKEHVRQIMRLDPTFGGIDEFEAAVGDLRKVVHSVSAAKIVDHIMDNNHYRIVAGRRMPNEVTWHRVRALLLTEKIRDILAARNTASDDVLAMLGNELAETLNQERYWHEAIPNRMIMEDAD